MATLVSKKYLTSFRRALLIAFACLPLIGIAQKKNVFLETPITISFENEELEVALKRISQSANFSFSYKSSLIEKGKRVSYTFTNKPVREILDEIFKGRVEYKEKGRHIILTKAPESQGSGSTVSGYIIDEATGRRLQNVSVYDPVSLRSTVTDASGYFKIDVKNPSGEEIKLAVKKRAYADTVVVVPRNGTFVLRVPIRIDKERLTVLKDSVGSKLKRFWLTTKAATEQVVNMENIGDSIYSTWQFSVIPFVGTNGKLSGNVINSYSLNLFGGYSYGNNIVEVGGFFNTIRGNVNGVQIAGLVNGVMGTQSGAQIAGLVNVVRDSANGFQGAGLANVSFGYSEGVKLAGLLNVALHDSRAVQFAGLANFVHRNTDRPQLAGLFNMATGESGPAQVAGLFNFSGRGFHGTQLAGLLNVGLNEVRGTQVSGLLNLSPKDMKGLQLGVMNVAKNIAGVQLGVFNVSNDIKGIPIGLISIVGKGYHKVEVSADEIFHTNIAFRTGVRQFYNIITAGAMPETFNDEKTLWTFGYGIGTAPKLSRRLYLNFDLTSNQIVDGNKVNEKHLLNKFYGGVDFQIAKNFSITAGVTLNGLLTEASYDGYPDIFANYTPSFISDRTFDREDLNLKMWWGGKVGLRFF